MVKKINLVLIQHIRMFGGRGRTHSKWGSIGVCVCGGRERTHNLDGERVHTKWGSRKRFGFSFITANWEENNVYNLFYMLNVYVQLLNKLFIPIIQGGEGYLC